MRVHPYGLEKLCQRSKHFAYLIWMFAGAWDGYQPQTSQTWCYGIIFTPQVTLNSQIWGQLAWWNDKGAPICIWLWDSNQWGSNTLHISNMDVWSGLRVNISLNHNLMISFLLHKWTWKFPKLGLTWLVEWYKDEGAPIYGLEKSYQRSKHFAYLIWMFAGVWDGYQPQTWCYDIISTPQVTSWIPKSGANLAGGMLYKPPYAFATAYQWLKHCVYVEY